MNKFILYLPRILSVGLCFFFGIFILEGFDSNFGWQSGVVHAIPTILMIIITVFSWKKSKIGGLLFLSIALFMLLFGIFRQWRESIIFVGIMSVIGVLFLLGAKQSK